MADDNAKAVTMLTADQASRLIMVSAERVRQLGKDGYFTKNGRGQFPMVGVVQGYIRFLKDEERRGSKVAADSGLKAARQREVELRIAREEGRLVDMADVEAVFDAIQGNLRAQLSAVPAAVTRDIALRGEIEKAINDAFARASAKFGEASEALQQGRNPLEADEADDA